MGAEGPRPRFEFLKKRSDYLALRSGDRASTPSFLMARRRREVDGGVARIGLTVTKALGTAVVRNRIRRRLREVVRAEFAERADSRCDYVLIARAGALTRSFPQLLDDFRRALQRLSAHPK